MAASFLHWNLISSYLFECDNDCVVVLLIHFVPTIYFHGGHVDAVADFI